MPEFPKRGYLRMDLADNCNIRCIMCQAYNSMPVSAMQFVDFDRFVQNTRGELQEWQRIQLGNIAEATVHPRFADFVRYIRTEAPDALIHVVTNGKLLGRYAALFNEVGNCLVQVSMDSVTKATHEYIRHGSNFERALAGIEALDLARTQVLLSFTLMASNIDEYPAMTEFCRSRGYQMSAFPMAVRTEGGMVPLGLLRECLWFHLDKLRVWLRDHYGERYALMVGTATGAAEYVTDFSCNAHFDDFNVDAAGNTNLCGKLGLGSLMKRPLGDLWHSDDARAFRDAVEADRGPCMTCDYRQRCLSPSMALLDNHFDQTIVRAMSPAVKKTIAYDRTMSDEEALWHLVADVQERVGVFDISERDGRHAARRVVGGPNGQLYFAEPIVAPSRHELQRQMHELSASQLYPTLVDEGVHGQNIVRYDGWFYVIPQSLGPVNLTRDLDREQPAIRRAGSLDSARQLCAGG
jgi:radical SAM protein with 4Fe4S-binding SPASM domain